MKKKCPYRQQIQLYNASGEPVRKIEYDTTPAATLIDDNLEYPVPDSGSPRAETLNMPNTLDVLEYSAQDIGSP